MPIYFHKIMVGLLRLLNQRVITLGNLGSFVQLGQNMTLRIHENDMMVDRIFGHIFLKKNGKGVLLSCINAPLRLAGDDKAPDVIIGSQKADIGRALKKISDQNVDGNLRHRSLFLHGFLQRLQTKLA